MATKKTAAKKTTAKKITTQQTTVTPKQPADYVRDAVAVSIGIPFAVRNRLPELPKFELPKFELPKLDLAKLDLSNFDLPTERIAGFVADAKLQGAVRLSAVEQRVRRLIPA